MNYLKLSEKVEDIISDANKAEQVVVDRKNLNPIVFNQRETIKRINAYINDRYLERDDDAIFWNISNHRITHFAKLLGLDTKDFLPYADGDYNMFQSWALRKQAKRWFKDSNFYEKLNDISEGISTYGSIVWKKYRKDGKNELEECSLDRLYFDQTARSIRDTDVVELHDLTEAQLWEKMDVWDNVQKVIDKIEKDKKTAEVWEFTGWFKKDEDDRPVYKHAFGYGTGNDEIILYEEDIKPKDNQYKDFHLGRYRGRWLRVGVPERLFRLQERINTLVNQNAQTTEIASLLLLRSGQQDSTGNVLEQAINGQIIPDETLEQIGITNTGLNAFVQEMQMIEQQADRLCLTPEIIQGEQGPSGTPFRSLAVVNAAAQSAFTAYKQNLGEKIADILVEDIFPDLIKDWNRGVAIELAEDDEDIEMYDKVMLRFLKKEYLLSTGKPVTPEIEQLLALEIENNIKETGRKIEMKEKFFDFKYGIKMMPTNESVDKAAMNDAMFNALQMTGANPAMVNIPLFKQYLENNGISWWKLTAKQAQEIQMGATGPMPEPKKPDALLAQASAQ